MHACTRAFEQHDWLTMAGDPRTIGQFPVHIHAVASKWSSKKFKHDGPQRFYRKRLPEWKAGTEIFISDFEW